MSLHVFANIVTPFGTAANNRAETEGNITTLQKLIWQGQTHTTVSAEAIRFSLRQLLDQIDGEAGGPGTNRRWDEDARVHRWQDAAFSGWLPEDKRKKGTDANRYVDDDLLGYMRADAAAEDSGGKGSATTRRAVLEVTRAISLTDWRGDVTFNAASPGATPSAQKGEGSNPVPYGAEVHATRYQYGVAMTPGRLAEPERAAVALKALASLRKVAGNHGRFLFDFAPDAIVIRITDDPAPRLLYCFQTDDDGKTFTADALLKRIECGDIDAAELLVGVSDLDSPLATQMKDAGVTVEGVRKTVDAACEKINERIGAKA